MNTPPTETEDASIKDEILALIGQLKSLQLATLNARGLPESSYTPFIYQAPYFYIFVSALASHTQNLTSRHHCSLMLIEDEAHARNLFARTRLMVAAEADVLDPADTEYEELLDVMEQTLGSTMKMLRTLPDFKLIRLTINGGRFVKGFGAAYAIKDPGFDHTELVTGK